MRNKKVEDPTKPVLPYFSLLKCLSGYQPFALKKLLIINS